MTIPPLRAVLDANVMVSALLTLSGSPSLDIYLAAQRNEFVLVTSKAILTEAARTLHEERIVNRYRLSERWLAKAIRNLTRVSDVTPLRMNLSGAVADDPNDDPVLATALKGKAQYVVTGDRHLLDLKTFHRVVILTPRSFLSVLKTANE